MPPEQITSERPRAERPTPVAVGGRLEGATFIGAGLMLCVVADLEGPLNERLRAWLAGPALLGRCDLCAEPCGTR